MKRIKFVWWRYLLLGVLVAVLLSVWIFVFGISSKQPGAFFNKGHNAVWIEHKWVGEFQSDSQIQTLVTELGKHEIDTVFVHAGPFEEDGNIDPKTYEYAINFLEKARKFNENIKYQAWLGQVRNKINLADGQVRHNVAKQAMILAQLVDFDGIHFDIEPVWDGDSDFIRTLKESREILSEDKTISVALAEFIPSSLIWLIGTVHEFENFNSEVNYGNVAEYADQIVVMAYDTGMKSERFYRWFVKEQTIWLSSLLEGKEIFIGIPAYEDGGERFDPRVENLRNALRGVIAGLNDFRSKDENFAGVAIYPYWEIDESEWEVYAELWLR